MRNLRSKDLKVLLEDVEFFQENKRSLNSFFNDTNEINEYRNCNVVDLTISPPIPDLLVDLSKKPDPFRKSLLKKRKVNPSKNIAEDLDEAGTKNKEEKKPRAIRKRNSRNNFKQVETTIKYRISNLPVYFNDKIGALRVELFSIGPYKNLIEFRDFSTNSRSFCSIKNSISCEQFIELSSSKVSNKDILTLIGWIELSQIKNGSLLMIEYSKYLESSNIINIVETKDFTSIYLFPSVLLDRICSQLNQSEIKIIIDNSPVAFIIFQPSQKNDRLEKPYLQPEALEIFSLNNNSISDNVKHLSAQINQLNEQGLNDLAVFISEKARQQILKTWQKDNNNTEKHDKTDNKESLDKYLVSSVEKSKEKSLQSDCESDSSSETGIWNEKNYRLLNNKDGDDDIVLVEKPVTSESFEYQIKSCIMIENGESHPENIARNLLFQFENSGM